MTKKGGKYVQIQVYISDYNERLIQRDLTQRDIDMGQFLEEIKMDAIMRAKQNLGGNARGRI